MSQLNCQSCLSDRRRQIAAAAHRPAPPLRAAPAQHGGVVATSASDAKGAPRFRR